MGIALVAMLAGVTAICYWFNRTGDTPNESKRRSSSP